MRAVAVHFAAKTVRLTDLPEPTIAQPFQVKLQAIEVGICGTDREIARFRAGRPPHGSDQLIIGHECLAQVVEVGSEAAGLKRGDLVVPTIRRPCPHPRCMACRSARPDFCLTGDYTERGIWEAHGFMSEFSVVNARYVSPVPASLLDVAVLVEPLTIAEAAIAQVARLQQRLPFGARHGRKATNEEGLGPERNHHALVLGAGANGLLGAMALVADGYQTFVYAREPAGGLKSKVVEGIGATYLPASEYQLENLPRLIGNIDVIFETWGASRLDAMTALGANGIFVFTSVPGGKAPVVGHSYEILRGMVQRNQVAIGVLAADRAAFRAAVRDLVFFKASWPSALQSIITGRVPPEHAERRLLEPASGIKHVIRSGETMP